MENGENCWKILYMIENGGKLLENDENGGNCWKMMEISRKW